MREILFRGKRVDNEHEWVYGNYHNHSSEKSTSFFKAFVGTPMTMYAVIPDTVGQYTGLTDKNGTRIFEGDIVRIFDGEYCSAVIKYSNEKGSFTADDTSLYYWVSDIEVVGNIHDNGYPF